MLDATAITVSLITKDFSTASSIMFLLGIGELLEEWTRKKSVDDLARSMSLNVSKVWLRTRESRYSLSLQRLKRATRLLSIWEMSYHSTERS